NALSQRLSTSPKRDNVQLLNGDCNIEVDKIVSAIKKEDDRFIEGKWSSLNLAFLDPEGLELKWETVEKLGSLGRMDLIINFSTSGVIRNARQMINMGQTTTIDDFFGTPEWKSIYENASKQDSTKVRRALIDFYKK